jgi:mycofactocin precursor
VLVSPPPTPTSADESPILQENAQVGGVSGAPAPDAAPAVEDLGDLVEDVSIDGMCGVY